jgi:hypothetical protein
MAARLMPGQTSSITSCTSYDWQLYTGMAVGLVGGLAGVVGVALLLRAARRSTANGAPWRVHEAMQHVADGMNRRVPGRSGERGPFSVGSVAGLVIAALVVVTALGVWGWNSFSDAATRRAYQRAQTSLAELPLPQPLIREASPVCQPSADTLCAHSSATVAQVVPIVTQLMGGQPDHTLCTLLPSPTGEPCPISGSIDGYPALGFVHPHLVLVTKGDPPPGAIPSRPGNTHLYWLGSDIQIQLLSPRT